ncbi:hypothetical protein DP49_5519 [Burkholderia pseudomallei]|nr:hypothetical protein DP49_5519 [Burkholderia pseudomallei]
MIFALAGREAAHGPITELRHRIDGARIIDRNETDRIFELRFRRFDGEPDHFFENAFPARDLIQAHRSEQAHGFRDAVRRIFFALLERCDQRVDDRIAAPRSETGNAEKTGEFRLVVCNDDAGVGRERADALLGNFGRQKTVLALGLGEIADLIRLLQGKDIRIIVGMSHSDHDRFSHVACFCFKEGPRFYRRFDARI